MRKLSRVNKISLKWTMGRLCTLNPAKIRKDKILYSNQSRRMMEFCG